MDRTSNTAINAIVGFALGYLVVARIRDSGSAVKTGLIVGTLTAVVAWLGYENPQPGERHTSE